MANRDKQLRRIWNMSDHEYRETFKGEEIVIKPHGYIEKGRRWAVEFMGSPTHFEADNPESIKNIKMLRWEAVTAGDKPEPPVGYRCQVCGQSFSSKQSLGGHMNTHKEQPAASKPA